MKKILNALFLTLLTVFTFSSCSDVPAPYDILGEGDVPGLTGDGTKENPYNIATASLKQDGSVAWVQGYIVGSADGASLADGSKFEAPFVGASNILIADDVNEKDYKKCIPVQLVAGTDLRAKLNLVDNAANLGQVVIIKGTLENYFKQAGVKAPTAAVLNGQEIGDSGEPTPGGNLVELLDPSNPVNQVVNTFDDAETDKDYVKEGYVNLAEVGGRTWRGKPFNNNGLIQATAYGSKEPSIISWFVTPAVNIAQMEVKKVTFDCISAYYKDGNKLEVYFLEKDGNNLKQTLLNVGTLPQNAEGYSDAKTLTGDLTSIGDKVGFIGFKFVGSETASGTYQIDNLYVGVEPGEGPGPGPDPDPVGDGTKENPYDVATALSLSAATGTTVAWVKGYIVGSVNSDNASSSVDGPEDIIFGVTGIRATALVIAGSANETDYKKCMVIGFGNDSQAAKTALNLVDNPDNLGKEVLLQGTLKYAFNAPGMKTITDHELVSGGEEPEGKVYTSNIALPTEDNSTDSYYGGKVKIDEVSYDILKLGTGSKSGKWTSLALGKSVTKLSFFAVGWTGKTGQLTVVIENGGTFEGGGTSKVVPLDGKTAGAANSSPFTITPADTDFYEYTMTGITASSTIKFTTEGATSDKRAIIFGVNIK